MGRDFMWSEKRMVRYSTCDIQTQLDGRLFIPVFSVLLSGLFSSPTQTVSFWGSLVPIYLVQRSLLSPFQLGLRGTI